jgi:hypothetical protein
MKYLLITCCFFFAIGSSIYANGPDPASRMIAKFEKYVTLTVEQKEAIRTKFSNEKKDIASMAKDERHVVVNALRRSIHNDILTQAQRDQILNAKDN